eukprot:7386453-Prymnesium_polylepis.1
MPAPARRPSSGSQASRRRARRSCSSSTWEGATAASVLADQASTYVPSWSVDEGLASERGIGPV